jgi:hypothetical protein
MLNRGRYGEPRKVRRTVGIANRQRHKPDSTARDEPLDDLSEKSEPVRGTWRRGVHKQLIEVDMVGLSKAAKLTPQLGILRIGE